MGGTYYYSGEERQLEDIMTVVFDTTGLSQAAVPVNHDLNGDSRSDILMANSPDMPEHGSFRTMLPSGGI